MTRGLAFVKRCARKSIISTGLLALSTGAFLVAESVMGVRTTPYGSLAISVVLLLSGLLFFDWYMSRIFLSELRSTSHLMSLLDVKHSIESTLKDQVHFYMYTPTGKNAVKMMVRVPPNDEVKSEHDVYLRRDRSLPGKAFLDRMPVTGEDVPSSRLRRFFVSQEEFRSSICIPLVDKERVVGIISIHSREPIAGEALGSIIEQVVHADGVRSLARLAAALEN